MGDIAKKLTDLKDRLPDRVKLVAVSKNHSVKEIKEAYECGHRIFGENRAQELLEKAPMLPGDIEWHFIGHLQTNKVKQIIPVVSVIHSVDSYKLLKEIEKEASKAQRKVFALLQFHIASEDSKYGLQRGDANDLMERLQTKPLKAVQLAGVMGMATFTSDADQVSGEFQELRNIFHWMKSSWFPDDPGFNELSMGMSDDYPVALEAGSTMIRVGSSIFG